MRKVTGGANTSLAMLWVWTNFSNIQLELKTYLISLKFRMGTGRSIDLIITTVAIKTVHCHRKSLIDID